MRLFVAVDIEEGIRAKIAELMDELRPLAPKARWVSPDSLHVTLKFIGEQPDARVPAIESTLAEISRSNFQLAFAGYGFFPTAKSARVFWIGIKADFQLGELANEVDNALFPLGIEKEKRAFSPHLTLARAGGGSGAPGRHKDDRPNQVFANLQKKLGGGPQPEFGTMTASEFFLYRSVLSSKGAQYTKIAGFNLAKQKK